MYLLNLSLKSRLSENQSFLRYIRTTITYYDQQSKKKKFCNVHITAEDDNLDVVTLK